MDKLVVFELKGKLACWKKFYTNSSSFTSFIPYRTNILGIIASVLELPRDSYYSELSTENCKISVEILSTLKKQFHCLNYFKKPNQRDYTQVRLEVLSPEDISQDMIKYRVYLWFKDNNKFTLEDFINRIKTKRLGFGVYLGQRQFRGDIEFIEVIDKFQISSNVSEISSITNISNLSSREDLDYSNSEIYIEKMPLDFIFSGTEEEKEKNICNRELQKVGEIVYNKLPNLLLKVKSNYKKVISFDFQGNLKNIAFYED